MPIAKLYVEGKLDLQVLQSAFAGSPVVERQGTKDDLSHLVRRERMANPSLDLAYLRDRDFDFEPPLQIPPSPHVIQSGGITHGFRWQRHEIENYLLSPALIERVFQVPQADTEAALQQAAIQICDYQAARWTMGQTRSLSRAGGRLQTRPQDLPEYGLPQDLSAAASHQWVDDSLNPIRTAQASALGLAEVSARFQGYQAKFTNLTPAEILVWFSGKDLLCAMAAWRNNPKIKAPQPVDVCAKITRWLERGNGAVLLSLVPEMDALATLLRA